MTAPFSYWCGAVAAVGSGRFAGEGCAPTRCRHLAVRPEHHQDRQRSRCACAYGLVEGSACGTGPLVLPALQGGKFGTTALSSDQLAPIAQRRAQLGVLEGDCAAHSLRSGFVTEAGRQGVLLGEMMAMTEHRSFSTVMGCFHAARCYPVVLLTSFSVDDAVQKPEES